MEYLGICNERGGAYVTENGFGEFANGLPCLKAVDIDVGITSGGAEKLFEYIAGNKGVKVLLFFYMIINNSGCMIRNYLGLSNG